MAMPLDISFLKILAYRVERKNSEEIVLVSLVMCRKVL